MNSIEIVDAMNHGTETDIKISNEPQTTGINIDPITCDGASYQVKVLNFEDPSSVQRQKREKEQLSLYRTCAPSTIMSEPDAIEPGLVQVLAFNAFWDSLRNRAGSAVNSAWMLPYHNCCSLLTTIWNLQMQRLTSGSVKAEGKICGCQQRYGVRSTPLG